MNKVTPRQFSFYPSASCGRQRCLRGERYTKTVACRFECCQIVVTVVADTSWRRTHMQTNAIKIYNKVPDVRWVITFCYVGTPYCYPLILSPTQLSWIIALAAVMVWEKKIPIRSIESVFIPAFSFDHFTFDNPSPSGEVKERVELHLCSPSGSSWSVIGRPLSLPYIRPFSLATSFVNFIFSRVSDLCVYITNYLCTFPLCF